MTTKTSITPAEKDAHRKVRPLDLDLRSMDAVGNIFRVANNFRVQAERSLLQKHNLSFTGFTVMWVLWVWGTKESYQLAQDAALSKSNLTGVLKTLYRHGFVERSVHPQDRRRLIISATPAGLALMDELFPQFNRLEKAATMDLSGQEKASLIRNLRVMLNTLEKQTG